MDYMNDLYDICEILSEALAEANGKIMQSGGQLSGSDLDYIDKLTHALKSVKTTIAMMEREGGSYDDGNSYNGGYSRAYSREGGASYMRGGYSRRRGRYSGYSREGDDMTSKLREMLETAPEGFKGDIQRLIEKAEKK